MTTGQQLLGAILLDPADDSARLAYSDWLEEHGEAERGEFIKVQVELAEWARRSNSNRLFSERWQGLVTRQQVLVTNANRAKWFALPEFIDATKYVIRRGFVASITCAATEFVRHAETLFRAHPIEEVKLMDLSPFTPVTARVPQVEEFNYPFADFTLSFSRDAVRIVRFGGVWWDDRDIAKNTSIACVAYGRHKAELISEPASV